MIEEGEDALGGRHRGLHDVVFFGEIANRLIHALNVLDKGHDDARRLNHARHHQVPPYHKRRPIVSALNTSMMGKNIAL